jgi:hypothetical protein
MFKAAGPGFEQEFEAIEASDKPVIFFDEYALSQGIIRRIAEALPAAKFVVEIRTAIFEVRYHEVSQGVPKPFNRLGLNRLTAHDVEAFYDLCKGAGISISKKNRVREGAELRDVLLEVLESNIIRKKIEDEIRPIFGNAAKRRVLLLATLLSKFHLSTDAGFIRTVTGVDPYHEFKPIQEISDELFETNTDEFRVRSAVFADFAVRNILTTAEILECIASSVLAAAARKNDRVYRVLMANLMEYSNLREVLKEEAGAGKLVIGLYEQLRHDDRINNEPLFWLQYAIAEIEDGELPVAEQFIRTAYDRAAATPGFRTYQIDTQALRILLLIETEESSGAPVARIQEIIAKLGVLNSLLREESHRSFAIKVLEGLEPFLRKRRGDLQTAERNLLVFVMHEVVDTLRGLPPEYRARSGSDESRRRIEAAINLLL